MPDVGRRPTARADGLVAERHISGVTRRTPSERRPHLTRAEYDVQFFLQCSPPCAALGGG